MRLKLFPFRVSTTSIHTLQIISFTLIFVYVINIPTRNLASNQLSKNGSVLEKLSTNKNWIWSTSPIIENDWKIPSSFDSQLNRYNRNNLFTQEQLQYPWYRPQVYLYSTRPSYRNESERVISLYTQGIRMGGYQGYDRNFSAVGCLVGSTVYPFSKTTGTEIYICKVDHEVNSGELLSVVLQSNEYLEKALTLETVTLNHGLKVTLQPGDVNPVPDDFHITAPVRSKTNGKKLYYARSLAKFEANLEFTPVKKRKENVRYEICGCTQNKLYPLLTEPWVDYHRRLGMDYIIVIDNNATADLQKTFAHRSDVTVYFFPYGKSQMQIWAYIMQKLFTKCEWLFLFDADEYLMFGIGKNMEYATRRPLKIYTNRLRENGMIAATIYYTLIESSGQLNVPDDPPPQVYVHAASFQRVQCKMMIRTDYPWARASIHQHVNLRNTVPSDSQGKTSTSRGIVARPVELSDHPTLIHYRKRSWEEWKIKYQTERAALTKNHPTSLSVHAMSVFLRKSKDELKYTYFKTMWETITKKADMDFQTLVKTKNGRRCTAVIKASSKSIVKEFCKDIDQEKEDKFSLMN